MALAMLLAFVPLILLIPPSILYLYTACILFTTMFVFIHAYWPAMRTSINLTVRELERVDILTLALFIVFVTVDAREAYITLYREILPLPEGFGRPEKYFMFLSFMQYCSLVAALLAISARSGTLGPTFMSTIPGWPRGILAIVTGVALATVFIISR